MQNETNQYAPCKVCRAKPGEPCRTRYDRVAAQAHWGRRQASERAREAPAWYPPPRPDRGPASIARRRAYVDAAAEVERRRFGD
jgi:hypothetical protein